MHGGGPPVTAGQPLNEAYRNENVDLLTAGCCNMARHIQNSRSYGVPVIVAINRFATDTEAELAAVKQAALDAGDCSVKSMLSANAVRLCRRKAPDEAAYFLVLTQRTTPATEASAAVVAEHHAYGGKGAVDLAKAVIEAAKQPSDFRCGKHFGSLVETGFEQTGRCQTTHRV